MGNNPNNINKTNNYLKPKIIEHENDHDSWLWDEHKIVSS